MPSYTSQGVVESSRPAFLPAGKYTATVMNSEEKTSKSGNEMIELRLEISGDDIEEGKGPIVYDNLVFTENSAWRIDQFRSALGEDIVEGAEVEVEPDDLLDARVSVTLSVDEYEGKKRNKVVQYEELSNPF